MQSWKNLVEKIDRMRDELDAARAAIEDASDAFGGRHKTDIAHALYVVVEQLKDLTYWAHCPDPEPLPAGWLDAVKDGLQTSITNAIAHADRLKEPKVRRILRDVHSIALEYATAMATRTVETTPPVVEAVRESPNRQAKIATKKATVNARMIDVLGREPVAAGWTAAKWAARLKCSDAAIVGTNVWKSMQLDKGEAKAEHASKRAREKRRK